jgi:D-alanyl-D-alanine carboxypeptidase
VLPYRGYDRGVVRFLCVPVVLMALTPFHASTQLLPPKVKTQLKAGGFWHKGCPVPLSDLRLLTVTHRDRHGHPTMGQLVVNKRAAAPLTRVFRKLYALHFPIRHMQLSDAYGPKSQRPADNDISGSFECRQAVPSPCTGGRGTGTWSMHAYGLAVDLNPRENPYVGCGQSRDPKTRKYFDRSRHRPLMVTRKVVRAFASVGWGWGGSWTGNTKDYMHFSSTGH